MHTTRRIIIGWNVVATDGRLLRQYREDQRPLAARYVDSRAPIGARIEPLEVTRKDYM